MFRTDYDDLDGAGNELGVILAPLRRMRLAERSGEGAVEDQSDDLHPAEIGQADRIAAVFGEAEVRSDLVKGYTWHFDSPI